MVPFQGLDFSEPTAGQQQKTDAVDGFRFGGGLAVRGHVLVHEALTEFLKGWGGLAPVTLSPRIAAEPDLGKVPHGFRSHRVWGEGAIRARMACI